MSNSKTENTISKLQTKANWFAFVHQMFSRLEEYAKRYNALERVKDDIYKTADLVAEEVWNLSETIDGWAVGYIRMCVFNNDNKHNPSPARIVDENMKQLLRKIENDPEFSEKMELLSLYLNESFDSSVMEV